MNLKVTVLASAVLLAGCNATQPTIGSEKASTVATGAAGGATATNANVALEKCASPLGTVALVEETSAEWYRMFTTEYRLGSTVPVLRLMIQQSNCFIVVERGRAMAGMERERAIAASGQGRVGSNFGGGQMVAADYSMTPEVLISARGTSGIGGGLAGLGGGRLALLGAVAGGIRTNEAATMLMLTDNRSGVQVSASQGSSSNTDFSVGAVLFGGGGAAGLGGYTSTPQGKVVIAAFTDSYNQMVQALRSYKPQTVQGQGLGGGGKLTVDGAALPSQTAAPGGVPAAVSQPAAAPANSVKPTVSRPAAVKAPVKKP